MLLSRGHRWGVCLLVGLLSPCVAPVAPTRAAAMPQIASFNAWDALPGDGFGWSVALDGQHVLVGKPVPGTSPGPGSAYLYDPTDGSPLATLVSDDSTVSDHFGSAVAVGQGIAVVGAPFAGSNRSELAGAAYLFEVNTGTQLFKLTSPDSEALDRFGSAVAIEGPNVVVGAWADNTPAGVNAGSVYVFHAGTGQLFRGLRPLDASPGARYGSSAALDGTTALIGAPHDSLSAHQAGAAYTFDVTEGRQLFKLAANDPAPGAHFGASVAIKDNLAIIGAPAGGAYEAPGAAYVFDLATGQQRYKLTASDAAVGDGFGVSVAINHDIAIVGATLGATDASTLAGAAYVFDLATGLELAKLTANDSQAIDFFGGSVALSGTHAAVGAYGRNTPAGVDAGSAYLFSLSTPTLRGDLDGDGFVGIADLNLVIGNWNQTVPAGDLGLGDLSADGFVGIEDLTLVLSAWNTGAPPASGGPTRIPEPGLIPLALIGIHLVLRPR